MLSKLIPDSSVNKESDLKAFELKGDVKEWTRWSYEYSRNDFKKHLIQKEDFMFNRAGMVLAVKRYNEKQALVSHDSKVYDDKGRIQKELYYQGSGQIIRDVNYIYSSEGYLLVSLDQNRVNNFIYTTKWTYDKAAFKKLYEYYFAENYKEKLLTKIVTQYLATEDQLQVDHYEYKQEGGLHFHKTSLYNSSYRLINEIEKDSHKNILQKKQIHYNSAGKPLSQQQWKRNQDTGQLIELNTRWEYDAENRMILKSDNLEIEANIYDSEGRVVESRLSQADGTLKSREVYHYDKNRWLQITESERYDDSGHFLCEYIYHYDEKGRILSWSKTDDAKNVLFTFPQNYDSKGNLVSQVQEGPYKDDLYRYEYYYDDASNRVQTLCYYLGKITALTYTKPGLYLEYDYDIGYWE